MMSCSMLPCMLGCRRRVHAVTVEHAAMLLCMPPSRRLSVCHTVMPRRHHRSVVDARWLLAARPLRTRRAHCWGMPHRRYGD
ncbi:hypothetical protein K440DRAFT_297364 [Wilcoxina mikolae CBS 423.85]|nr:hypothetical protein K440DRAFT_297364 [Wilcoxina mikolae CBS 423.85]